jgi:glycolate oxidase FAD binding subunit
MQALSELRDRILAAAKERRPLRIHGGDTKAFYGRPPQGDALDTRALTGILEYEPTELAIRVLSGTPLAEVEAALAERGQMLAFEPPVFGAGSTIGGVIAAGLSGPRRASAGAARDFVLGAALLDGQGRLQNFGGQVMKNVAGYDVSRLLCGSLGMLGVIAEVSLKVLPRPAAEATVRMTTAVRDAVTRLNAWGGQPLPISASAWVDGLLTVRLSGARAAVDEALARFAGREAAQPVDPAEAETFWAEVRDQRHPFFAGEAPLWRLSVPSTAAPTPGTQLIEWGGALRWLRSDAPPEEVRALARAAGGSATLFRAEDRTAGVFDPLSPPLLELHRRLKREFDPAGLFNPGRMYPEL